MPGSKRAKAVWTKRELSEQHRRDRQAGVEEEFLYHPNSSSRVPVKQRHDAKPGQADLRNVKVGIHIKLDADIVEFFKGRAAEPNAAPYQTQINTALREIVDNRVAPTPPPSVEAIAGQLLHNRVFIESVRARTRRRA